ncbi:RNI-like superfamily protein [Perilla frutescens var. hirtella]|nr:RNI-like superfamily protein [Perilla frutescens var. hirtella]
MEKGKSKDSAGTVTDSFRILQLDHNSANPKSTHNSVAFPLQSQLLSSKRRKAPPSLLSLCLGVVGCNLEDIIDDLAEIALAFPADIKMALVAIARRRKLLNDAIVVALADSSWEILDMSGSDVSDSGLSHVVNICHNLKAVDIRRCTRLTPTGVSELLQLCHSLEILRWGGCPRSDYVVRRCLSLLKPNLNDVEGDSWEELDAVQLIHGARSLRWLVWPTIDDDSQETLTSECPRIVVNPKPSLLGFRGTEVPQAAVVQFALDDQIVKDVDPKTWAVSGFIASRAAVLRAADPNELSVAEKFRLAFVERDTRLAPKRAKNTRQHQRRAEREWVTTDIKAKAVALASRANRYI